MQWAHFGMVIIATLQLVIAMDLDNNTMFSLKGQLLPSDGTGIVIFKDIGGYLGPEDGLICNASTSEYLADWYYPNGVVIKSSPSVDIFGIGYPECHSYHSVSLYYSGNPVQRGQFQCKTSVEGLPDVTGKIYIIDMKVIGPTRIGSQTLLLAGDDVQLSVNVTILMPEHDNDITVPVPYQWFVNGTKLQPNGVKYEGTQNNTLTLYNLQSEDEGMYSCSVAHSTSGITKPMNISVVTIRVKLHTSISSDPLLGHSFTLTCALKGEAPLADLNSKIEYMWFKDGSQLYENGDTHEFKFFTFKESGSYQCQVFVTFDNSLASRRSINFTSQQVALVLPAVVYRIYLNNIANCDEWVQFNIKDKLFDIRKRIIQGLKKIKECNLIPAEPDKLLMNDTHAYKCPKYSKRSVIYNAHLRGIPQANTIVLVSCLNQWIRETNSITVDAVEYTINKDCCKVEDYGDDTKECFSQIGLPIGSIAAIVLGCALAAILGIFITRKIWKKRRCDYDQLGGQRQ